MNPQVKVPAKWDREIALLFRAVLANVTDLEAGVTLGLDIPDINDRMRWDLPPAIGGKGPPTDEKLWGIFLQSACRACGAEIVIKTWAQFWGPNGVPVDDLDLAARHSIFIEKRGPRNVL